ncbi:glycosyltransferase [Coprobacter fastidiosus]|uniref:glycosyltransferase n=1 Tax=Coprobacter fastidiosus TaxID=1099853 RepID=UPI00320A6478
MTKQKIFVSAYACEPGLGSEIGVGWHWVLEMSKYFDLWVLTRESNRQSIEPWIAKHPEYNHIHFLYFDLPKWARFWKKGLRGVRIYYNIWQWMTNGMVRQTMQENDIRIFHHLTYGNVLWRVSKYGQKQFFIWGPAGGVETIPEEYSRVYPKKMQMVEWLRRTVAGNLKFNIGFKRRCRNADLILCKTDILRQYIPARYRDKAILFTDVAVDNLSGAPVIVECEPNKRIEFITVGRLDPWRGFDLVIEAFAKVVKKNGNMHLTVIGKGADKERLTALITKLKLTDKVTMAGSVDMERYREYMRNCDVVVNASLKEGAVTVSFDSMAMGKPLICIDTTGYTRYFSPEYAEIIQRNDRKSTIQALADSMVKLADAHTRYEMGKKAQQAGNRFTWASRGEEIFDVVTKAAKGKGIK